MKVGADPVHRGGGRTVLQVARPRDLRLAERHLREQPVGQGLRVEQVAYQLLRLVAIGLAEVVALGGDEGLVLGRHQHAEQFPLPLHLFAPTRSAFHIADGLQHALPLQGQVQGRAVAHLQVFQRLHGLVVLVDADRSDVVRRNVARGDGITPAQQVEIFYIKLVDGLAVVIDAPVILHPYARQPFDDIFDAPVGLTAEGCHIIQQRVAQGPDWRHPHHHFLQFECFLPQAHVHRLCRVVHRPLQRLVAHAREHQAQRFGQGLQQQSVTSFAVGNGIGQHPAIGIHRLDHRTRQRFPLVRTHHAFHLGGQTAAQSYCPKDYQHKRTPHPPTPVLSGCKTSSFWGFPPQNHLHSWVDIPSLLSSSKSDSYTPTKPC